MKDNGILLLALAARYKPLVCRACGRTVAAGQKFCGNCANPVVLQ